MDAALGAAIRSSGIGQLKKTGVHEKEKKHSINGPGQVRAKPAQPSSSSSRPSPAPPPPAPSNFTASPGPPPPGPPGPPGPSSSPPPGPPMSQAAEPAPTPAAPATQPRKKKKKKEKKKKPPADAEAQAYFPMFEEQNDDILMISAVTDMDLDAREHKPHLGRLFLLNLLFAADFGAWFPSLHPLAYDHGVTVHECMGILATYAICSCLSSIVVSYYLQRKPVINIMIWSSLFAIGSIAIYLKTDNIHVNEEIYFLYIGRGLMGIGSGVTTAGYGHIVRHSLPFQRGRRVALYRGLDLVTRMSWVGFGSMVTKWTTVHIWHFSPPTAYMFFLLPLFSIYLLLAIAAWCLRHRPVSDESSAFSIKLLKLLTNDGGAGESLQNAGYVDRTNDIHRGYAGTALVFVSIQTVLLGLIWAYLISFLGDLSLESVEWQTVGRYDLFFFMALVALVVVLLFIRGYPSLDSPQPLMTAMLGLLSCLLVASSFKGVSSLDSWEPIWDFPLFFTVSLMTISFTLATIITLATYLMWSSSKNASHDSALLGFSALAYLAGPVVGYLGFEYTGHFFVYSMNMLALLFALCLSFLVLLRPEYTNVRSSMLNDQGLRSSGAGSVNSSASAFSVGLLSADYQDRSSTVLGADWENFN